MHLKVLGKYLPYAVLFITCFLFFTSVRQEQDGLSKKSCDHLFSLKMAKYRKRQNARIEAVKASPPDWPEAWAYDYFEPEWDCELQQRIGGAFGDGGKFICGMEVMESDTSCLVYSIGSAYETSFEESVRNHSKCEIHTFDPTIDVHKLDDVASRYNFKVHQWGLGSTERPWQKGVVMPLSLIMQKLGHTGRHINLLKVDCEGCEHEIGQALFEECASGRIRIDQMLIEMHGTSLKDINKFFEGADKCGLMIFHKERNHWGCSGFRCVEFSLVSRHAALSSFKKSHLCE